MGSYEKLAIDFSGGIKAANEILCHYVDNSPYSVEEWHEALDFLHLWIQKKNVSSDLLSMLGYIKCCVMSQSQLAGVTSLVDILEQMLEDYGFDRSQPL